jgi:hypothetical protein
VTKTSPTGLCMSFSNPSISKTASLSFQVGTPDELCALLCTRVVVRLHKHVGVCNLGLSCMLWD